ncbi:MAG: hypothetical protein GX310_04060 [Synergistaceae bacterium]|nr:hypothetical protein [Synergistaceae bacterium]
MNAAARLREIQDKVNESIQYSIDNLAALMEEERERLFDIRTRREAVQKEHGEVLTASERAEGEYRRARQILLGASRSGEESWEKEAYERAMNLMKVRGAFEEREKLLAAQRDELDREERRTERLLRRTGEMGNRFRVVLNLLNANLDDEDLAAPAGPGDWGAGIRLAERESASLARDLHDGPIQKFSAAGLMIDLAGEYLSRGDFERTRAELARTRNQITDAMDEFRSFLFQLNPAGLKDGFEPALRRLASRLGAISGADIKFSVEGCAGDEPMLLRVSVYKIIQEAAINSIKNGAARRVRILISATPEMLRASITDDGKGFDVEKTLAEAGEKSGWGLLNMKERALLVGGELVILSEPGRGATVTLAVPLPVFRR